MNNHSQQIVQKLWNSCNLLRDDGVVQIGTIVWPSEANLPDVPCQRHDA